MRIERLQIDLRPRPHAQALDLGFALLRAHAADAWLAWLALWLPAVALSLLLAWLAPAYAQLWVLVPWWLRPALERAPLHVLARGVFGERTTWRAALRAWPRELRGGMVRMLTWWRPFMTGRALHHPVWQLEGARGAPATRRRRLLARGGTGRAAWLFGTACYLFEAVLLLGVIGVASLFMPDNPNANPLHAMTLLTTDSFGASVLIAAGVTLGGAVIGPIYVACCFTLYLNRRAALEAWDIELVLRRLQPPPAGRPRGPARGAATTLALLLSLGLGLAAAPPPALAADTLQCPPPFPWMKPQRGPDHDAAQARLRREIDGLYAEPDLRGYRCTETWQRKRGFDTKPPPSAADLQPYALWLAALAWGLKYALIATAVLAAAWLLYRYRDQLPGLPKRAARLQATEVGGLDIRPASLPDDVPATVRQLWQAGQQRAALALLYRATLSRLASDDGLHLYPGATEGDCLRLARQARAAGRLGEARLAVAADVTTLWLQGAYGGRWPDDVRIGTVCDAWQARFAAPVRESA
ncbi:hypothetical protein IP91_04880 [Pseudoduganella lurida]|uniref:DUF4129 domain-containing protein n=1 Tax=Pseudoduganella lurida TaxID=1036180 RepID=A0A562QXQ9_9BURK|nr:DUF4175 domain-containing protein [Pseudoduganella lurida]TWI60916.1 hypothetical protein IP91_04880 [Pseudoduganella lurida]